MIVPAERKGNVVARLRSPAPTQKPILVLAHIDVVEASPWDWTDFVNQLEPEEDDVRS